MDVHADMRRPAAHEAALRAVQKPPAKPWRGTTAAVPPPPPKVYRVEPREFRDLVQRLTGAPPAARDARQQQMAVQPVAVRAGAAGEEQQLYAPWFSFPLAGLDAHNGNGGGFM
ncbi:VQ motif-containing protein 29-like [Phragmites australis]|uniref:VQ motif-containing protein 29-like n=1 Tax=Phragmites australis TaxID=29695 RepID=UPI002D7A361A|nr:VQ motif-containing protein 29-like [Phragmites australis]